MDCGLIYRRPGETEVSVGTPYVCTVGIHPCYGLEESCLHTPAHPHSMPCSLNTDFNRKIITLNR